MKNVLVTGVSGFVGTNLVSYFKGHKEIAVFGHSRNEVVDVKQLTDWSASTLNRSKIDVVIHLAGIAHDLSNQYKPEDYYQVNYQGTKKVVDEVLKSDTSKFIYISSIKAACDTSSIPADETMKPNPVTDYGKSKLKAEEYIQSKAWAQGKSFYILRPGMIHGRGNKGNLNLLYRFVKSGTPFPFGAFRNQRSFLSIDNFCFVVQSLIEKEITSGVYHIADDGFLSTVELYRLISEATGKKPSVWNVPAKLIEGLAALVGKKSMISKLTEDMMISNKKIGDALRSSLPMSLKQGLEKTIRSFDGN
ncbi:MAG: NAD-dependent epimerase/dehydratase family protein [Bacteroidetes bacterium]|nr:NAD-dependent epimerase/dehydratase family protein [Bacteroidota bacterium]